MLTNERLDIIKKYRTICSEIIEKKLYLGGYYIASDLSKLEEYKITHIINMSGDTCINLFQDKIQYKTYFILDIPQESIESILYDSIEWIEEKFNQSEKNRILVHCQEGVSRSSTIVIGYLMWKNNKTFNEASDYVRSCRSTSSPNIGFTYQLLLFQKTLNLLKISNKDLSIKNSNQIITSQESMNYLGKEHYIFSNKLYYICNNLPVSLINWKNDADHNFKLNSNNIYLLRQTLFENDTFIHRERLWIWIGSQINENIRESIIGILRFCKQILKIEMGIDYSIELDNIEIRTDLILAALKSDQNKDTENFTNISSSAIILEYFEEFFETQEFMNLLTPNYKNIKTNSYEITQRSFSSPSIKSISRSPIYTDLNDHLDYQKHNYSSDSSSSNLNLNSLISADSSSSFSSLPSSDDSVSSINSPVNFGHQNSEISSYDQIDLDYPNINYDEPNYKFKNHHHSLDSQNILYSNEKNLFEQRSCNKKIFIPKLNITNQFLYNERQEINSNKSLKNQHPVHFNQDELVYNYTKRSSLSQENDEQIQLFRYPDYFKNESLKFFDSDDLLPEYVCPLVIKTKNVNIYENQKDNNKEYSIIIYFWIGSKTSFYYQAKKITKQLENNSYNVKELILNYNENSNYKDQVNICEIALSFINNISFIYIQNITAIYFEFEGEETDIFWNYFYQ